MVNPPKTRKFNYSVSSSQILRILSLIQETWRFLRIVVIATNIPSHSSCIVKIHFHSGMSCRNKQAYAIRSSTLYFLELD